MILIQIFAVTFFNKIITPSSSFLKEKIMLTIKKDCDNSALKGQRLEMIMEGN